MPVTFRPITEADFELAKAMKRATITAAMGDATLFDAWFPPERCFKTYMNTRLSFDPESCVFMLMDNTIIGHLHLMICEDGSGYLNDIYLQPDWRGQGLGAQMDAYAVRFFVKHGATSARLRTNPARPKLVDFYERMGWVLGDASTHGTVWMHKTLT